MSVSVEETQETQIEYELAQLFPNIEKEAIISEDFLNYITDPGVSKLIKLSRHLRMITNGRLEYESGFHSIKIQVKEPPAELRIEPWGAIHIETYSFKISIYNDFDENEPTFVEFGYKGNIISIGFYGRVEIEVDHQDNLTFRIKPKSKVYIFPH